MTTATIEGNEIADWFAVLVRSRSLGMATVTEGMGRTDEDLALLVATYTSGPTARLSRARQRAILGIPAHLSEPPRTAKRIAEVMRDRVSGAPFEGRLGEVLEVVRDRWRTTHAVEVQRPE